MIVPLIMADVRGPEIAAVACLSETGNHDEMMLCSHSGQQIEKCEITLSLQKM